MRLGVRVVVVGSGIVGASAAYAATCAGADVVLVDAAVQGQATSAGAGIISPWTSRVDDPDWYEFARAAADAYPDLVAELAEHGETNLGYRRVGALSLVADAADQQRLVEQVSARARNAPEAGEVRPVTGGEAQDLFPPLSSDTCAVYVGGASRVDGRLMRDALVRAAARSGARVEGGEARLVCQSERVVGVAVGDQLIAADSVIAATGAWTPRFVEPAEIEIAVAPQRGQIVHLRVQQDGTGDWPVVLPGLSSHYLLAFDDSRVVVGATRETDSGFDLRVTAGGLAEVLGEALSVAPGLASATHIETRVGFRPVGPDPRPLLGPVPGVDGLVVATGLGPSGLTMGPYAGALAARLALGLSVEVDLSPFDPLRRG